MNTQRGRNSLTVAGAVALALAAAAAGAQTAESTSLGEVIVTAQKRSEAIADIPMSVSVVAGETLERQRVENFEDLAALVPGLSLVSATPGITRVTMRGINTGGVASTVGIYLDDVPFGSSSGLANAAILSGDIDTFDMARVEVLRGPQGTLYGASALGGVIKYVANAPSTDGFEGRLQGSVEDVAGAGLGYGLTGVVNIPMGDSFAVRASGFYRTTGGYIDSIGTDPIPALQDPSVNIVDGTLVEGDINDSEVVGGRVSALFTPSETFSLDLSVHYQNIDSDNQGSFEVDPATLQPQDGRRVASRYHNEPTDIEYRLYSATLDWDFGGVSLQSVTSYSEFLEDFERDVATLDLIGTGLGTAQLLTFAYSTPRNDRHAAVRRAVPGTRVPTSSRRSSAWYRRKATGSSGCSALSTRTRIPSSTRKPLQSRPLRMTSWPTYPSTRTSGSTPHTKSLRCSGMRPGTSPTGSTSRSERVGVKTTRMLRNSSRFGFRSS